MTAALMRSLLSATLIMVTLTAAAEEDWTALPTLPDAEGFAGSFAGVSGGALLVAGGTNFPDKRPWEGGTKIWYDTIYALEEPEGPWMKVGQLPTPNGYGVSITTEDGLVCIGGGDAGGNFRDVFRLRYADGKVTTQALPMLPKACAFMAGAEMGGVMYVAGGIETPTATKALGTFWALDLKKVDLGWQELPPCPGPARILATMAAHEGVVYLISGAGLKADAEGKPAREWLSDAWSFQPNQGWKKIATIPRVAVAAPSPASVVDGQIIVLGGDDGVNVNFEPKEKHPGFPREILAYDPGSDTWSGIGDLPFSLVTTPAVEWKGRTVIPGGEARPGKRSPAVWSGKIGVP
ncbi:galactose oxidase-like protein [Prosthecobacter fusiformis]|uniref:Galactose oxidase-like protein n=1 Tax=Prosthecobacter fusiformis TaxID=48464 RepID=A0A4R7RZL1_9BACT|nr:galactose oxidase [Prosthecobacter fusiformis]TDU70586.1 galactose oxidase-like protein [Prosthecobacter fusiformis]